MRVHLPSGAVVVKTIAGTSLKAAERELILAALDTNKGNKTHTAKALGIGLRTLQRKLKQYKEQTNVG